MDAEAARQKARKMKRRRWECESSCQGSYDAGQSKIYAHLAAFRSIMRRGGNHHTSSGNARVAARII